MITVPWRNEPLAAKSSNKETFNKEKIEDASPLSRLNTNYLRKEVWTIGTRKHYII